MTTKKTPKRTRVCLYLDKDVNLQFKRNYPYCMSKYVEKCLRIGLKNKKQVYDSLKEWK